MINKYKETINDMEDVGEISKYEKKMNKEISAYSTTLDKISRKLWKINIAKVQSDIGGAIAIIKKKITNIPFAGIEAQFDLIVAKATSMVEMWNKTKNEITGDDGKLTK